MRKPNRSAANARRYALVITGQRHPRQRRRRRVILNGYESWLSDEPYETLCELLYAKASGQDGVPLSRQVFGRIRRGLGEPPRALRMPSVIERCAKGKYRVVLRTDQIARDYTFARQPAGELAARYREPIMRRTYAVTRLS